MTVVWLHDFVKESISASFKSFLLIMCIDALESTTNSRSSSLRFDAGKHLFSEGEKDAALFFSFNFRTLLASLHAASRAPCSCHSVSSWDRPSNFGALGLRSWVHLGKLFRAKDFGLECQRDVQRLSWILHIETVSVRLSSSVKSMKTSAAPYPGIRNPVAVYLMSRHSQQVSLSLMLLMPFQHSHCPFVTVLFGPFARLFFNLAMRIRLIPKSATTLGLVEQAFWKMPLFYRMNWCKFLWSTPCRAIETFYHWDSFLWDFGFSTHFSHSVAWKNPKTDSAVSFSHAY